MGVSGFIQGNIFAPVCHSVHRGVWSQGGACSGGCMLLGGSGPRGVPAPGGALVLSGASRLTPKGEIQGDQVQAHTQGEIQGDQDQSPPTATAVGGTHPTGMHSCSRYSENI